MTGSAFVVRRRNIDYAVTLTGCSIDDPADGAGVGDTTYCAASTSNPGNPAVGSGFAAGVNVLGIVPVSVVAGGSLMQTACNIIGTDTAIGNSVSGTATSLLGLVGNGAQVVTCPSAVRRIDRLRLDAGRSAPRAREGPNGPRPRSRTR